MVTGVGQSGFVCCPEAGREAFWTSLEVQRECTLVCQSLVAALTNFLNVQGLEEDTRIGEFCCVTTPYLGDQRGTQGADSPFPTAAAAVQARIRKHFLPGQRL